MKSDLLYQLALTLIPHIGPVQARILLQYYDAAGIFQAKRSDLERIDGIGSIRANSIKEFRDFSVAEEEISFIKKYGITPLFITDPAYPKRLLNCYDCPILLYYRGHADLNASRVVSVIGTRSNTEYGRQLTENLIAELAALQVMVVSGLAYGIDAIAHKAALQHQLSTIGVLAHGLDQVYPAAHTSLAKDMIRENGGLLTEFRSHSKPDKHHFPIRNRIVAGMSDATVVIETGPKGGSMITAELADGYNRDVFAFPGKITDLKSSGCNQLIKNNKAVLLSDPRDLADLMNWQENSRPLQGKKQKQFFIELSPEEEAVLNILRQKESSHIDEINLHSGLSCSATAAAILSLELQNVIVSLPGKLYRLD